MLLKSIKLKNFRQFRETSLDFADGKDGKNVTIVLGENGTGKTTFAQAFSWCLYGKTDFADKSLLNKMTEKELLPEEKAKVRVELCLLHGKVEYTLIREQTYQKDYSNKVKIENTTFDIAEKDETGNTTYVKKTLCDNEVNSILPEELSNYFFFDGERIERMSKDISTGKKSSDFAGAVQSLLGLNGMKKAIEHLNPRFKSSVISSYESSFDSNSDSKIKKYSEIIERCNEEIDSIDYRINELDNEIESAESRKKEKQEEIKQYEDGAKLQNTRENLQKKIDTASVAESKTYGTICNLFDTNITSYISLSLIDRAMKFLDDKEFSGVDIPSVDDKTIQYLLDRKVCLCGTHLDEGTVPYLNVKKLLGLVAPNNVANKVGDFKKTAKGRVNRYQDLPDKIKENLDIVSHQDDDILGYKDELQAIESKLKGGDVRDKVRTINNEIVECDRIIDKDKAERDKKQREKGAKENDRLRADTERKNLTLLDSNNKKIEIYKTYAERIFDELNKSYATSEANIRNKLQETINDIFKQIYQGGLYLTIDEKYHISVYANDYEGDVETSTAQSIAVIFAFITGIIKMARDNRNSSNTSDNLLSSEPYPLVMDAPLSAFDKRRIKTVCEALPKTAEQVIIFIKDTDGELAEEYMGDKIGSVHRFNKLNEFETELS